MTKEEITETAFKLAAMPERLNEKIDSIEKDTVSMVKGNYVKDLIIKSLRGKKNLYERVCGMNYFLNSIYKETRNGNLEEIIAIYKELLSYREELIKFKTE